MLSFHSDLLYSLNEVISISTKKSCLNTTLKHKQFNKHGNRRGSGGVGIRIGGEATHSSAGEKFTSNLSAKHFTGRRSLGVERLASRWLNLPARKVYIWLPSNFLVFSPMPKMKNTKTSVNIGQELNPCLWSVNNLERSISTLIDDYVQVCDFEQRFRR